MKKAYYTIIGLTILFVGQMLAQTVEVETRGPLTIEWYSASLPREDFENTAQQGDSWITAANNWMQAIRTEAPIVGTGRVEAKKISFCDYPGMITSPGFTSWRGVVTSLTPTKEYGNRQHFGFKVSSTTSFVPANIAYSLTTQVWSGGSWVNQLYDNASPSMNIDNNIFRQRLNAGLNGLYGDADDVIASPQSMIAPTNAFIFGGYGVSVPAYGSGADQDKLNNALSYMQAKKFRVLVTVSVPVNGTTYVFTNIFMPPAQNVGNLVLTYVPKGVETPAALTWAGDPAYLYQAEKSPDLQIWTPAGYTSGTGLLSLAVSDQADGAPKYFYRIRAW